MNKRMYKVISPIEKKEGGTYWMRCGVGYVNKDNSINLYVEALPVGIPPGSLKLQLREYTEEELRASAEKRASYQSRPGSPGGGSSGSYAMPLRGSPPLDGVGASSLASDVPF